MGRGWGEGGWGGVILTPWRRWAPSRKSNSWGEKQNKGRDWRGHVPFIRLRSGAGLPGCRRTLRSQPSGSDNSGTDIRQQIMKYGEEHCTSMSVQGRWRSRDEPEVFPAPARSDVSSISFVTLSSTLGMSEHFYDEHLKVYAIFFTRCCVDCGHSMSSSQIIPNSNQYLKWT